MPYKDPIRAKECRYRCYLRHKEEYDKKAKEWALSHPQKRKEVIRNNNAKSYVRKRLWIENDRYDGNATTVGKKCFICEAESSRNKSKSLAIHHIDGKNGKNGRELDNSPQNLIVLCVKCHAKIHSRWNFKNVYEYKQNYNQAR